MINEHTNFINLTTSTFYGIICWTTPIILDNRIPMMSVLTVVREIAIKQTLPTNY